MPKLRREKMNFQSQKNVKVKKRQKKKVNKSLPAGATVFFQKILDFFIYFEHSIFALKRKKEILHRLYFLIREQQTNNKFASFIVEIYLYSNKKQRTN
jgi:hypothetical protein